VASIIGEKGFRFLPQEYGIPAVVSGFEAEDILLSVYLLLRQLAEQNPRTENEYRRVVSAEGNPLAERMLERCFTLRRDTWRGLGEIDRSGYALRKELAAYDAEKKFAITVGAAKKTACRCGDVICGRIPPEACPMFGRRCVPEDPVGPCMVSSEGACAAAYKYASVL